MAAGRGNPVAAKSPGRFGVSGKLDGKQYQDSCSGGLQVTYRLRRIDDYTIEVIRKVPPIQIPEGLAAKPSPAILALSKGYEQKELWQVKGNTLRMTTTQIPKEGSPSEPTTTEYEREK